MIFLLFQISVSVAVVPTVPGLEYTLLDNRLHFIMQDNRLQYEIPENRLHYTMRNED